MGAAAGVAGAPAYRGSRRVCCSGALDTSDTLWPPAARGGGGFGARAARLPHGSGARVWQECSRSGRPPHPCDRLLSTGLLRPGEGRTGTGRGPYGREAADRSALTGANLPP
ncbi:hypothetical protein GCM10023079_52260 [Streptomyces chitinivorans]